MLNRQVLVLVVMAAVASACFSAEPPPPEVDPVILTPVTTEPEVPMAPVDEETEALIEDYWDARDAAWAAGVEAGIAFSVAFNHPLLPYTADDCREAWFNGEPPVGFAERSALAPDTILTDPDFMMSVGPLAGRDLGEGLVKMIVGFSYEGQDLRVADRVAEVHLQVTDDGDVRHFLLCENVPIIVVTPDPAVAGDGTGTTGDGTTTDGTGTPGGVVGDPVTVLPPITATPVPVAPGPGTDTDGDGDVDGDDDGDGDGDGAPSPPNPPGSRPPGTGIDFCDEGSPGAQPVAGDYYLCPDDDVDPDATESPNGGAQPSPSDDVTRG